MLEFIIRRDLDNYRSGGFGSDDIDCVSEVGVPVSDVLGAVEALSTGPGAQPYGLVPRASFAPVGGIDGMLILVAEQRSWFPANDRFSRASRTLVEATGLVPGQYRLGDESALLVGSG